MTDCTLHHWPIRFRGHFIRYLLAHAGASWDATVIDAGAAACPVVAHPRLMDNDTGRHLSQTAAILIYLGRKQALIAEPDKTFRLIAEVVDGLCEITGFHGAQIWDRTAWAGFTAIRLPQGMRVHERDVTANRARAEAGQRFGAETQSLAELTLAALWHTMVDKLPGLRQRPDDLDRRPLCRTGPGHAAA